MYWTILKAKTGAPAELARLDNDPNIVKTPTSSVFMASALTILCEDMGFRRSADAGSGQSADGSAMPLMSYGLVEYLSGLDLSEFDVLEIGGGESTEFWAARSKSVTTLESNPDWANSIRDRNKAAKVEFVEPGELERRIGEFECSFGIIVIDPAANRLACARAAVAKVKKGGFVILDNSDWYPNASKVLREAGLIEVDFHDFRPAHHYRATTSLYLTPEFRPVPKGKRLPLTPIGGKHIPGNHWDL